MTNGVLRGGGSDPTTEAAFSAFPVVDAFQTSACSKLKFRPKLTTKVLGGRKATRRAQNPKFRAILIARKGDANIAPDDGHPAQGADPRPEPHQDDLHAAPAGRRQLPEGLDLRPRRRNLAADRQEAARPGLPGALDPHPSRPARRPARPGQRAAARLGGIGQGRPPAQRLLRRCPTCR